MAKSTSNKHKVYSHYAARCLELTCSTNDQDDRAIPREMTAEWLKLAAAVAHPSNPKNEKASRTDPNICGATKPGTPTNLPKSVTRII